MCKTILATIYGLGLRISELIALKVTDIRIIQKLLGHRSIKTTLLYTQVAESTIQNIQSPIDSL